jgi:hypothetical protein
MITVFAKKGIEYAVSHAGKRPERSPEHSGWKRRVNKLGTALLALTGIGLGTVSGCNNVESQQVVEHAAEGGHATVQYIDRKLSRQEVIGFTTVVNGASATETIKRTGPLGIALPDITAGMTVDNYVVNSALCFDAGVKHIEKTIYDNSNRRDYRVEIDPADISVCSEQDLTQQAVNHPSGNWVDLINSASNDINRIFGGTDGTAEEDAKKSALLQQAQKMAQFTVNTQCGPLVFDQEKEDMKQLIAKEVSSDPNDTVEVVFKIDAAGKVAITGQSDLDKDIKQKQAEGWKIDAGSVGKCELPPKVAGGGDDRPKQN